MIPFCNICNRLFCNTKCLPDHYKSQIHKDNLRKYKYNDQRISQECKIKNRIKNHN
jgi:hypothetical protein